ncbi:hypothetical protein [Actinacidiphila glaucinigra]|uniref:hypothetical protein n=1 Tax=Actinacidiphila glaucinigra TaxID=235986 RepID=UPI0035E0CF71
MTGYGIVHIDNVVSSQFFWWPASTLSGRWQLLYLAGLRGGDENCNRTIGVRIPGGVVFACLNIPLRQKPCANCLQDLSS